MFDWIQIHLWITCFELLAKFGEPSMEGSILSVHFEFGAGQDKYFPESSPNSPPLLKKNKIKTKNKNKNKQTQTPLQENYKWKLK